MLDGRLLEKCKLEVKNHRESKEKVVDHRRTVLTNGEHETEERANVIYLG